MEPISAHFVKPTCKTFPIINHFRFSSYKSPLPMYSAYWLLYRNQEKSFMAVNLLSGLCDSLLAWRIEQICIQLNHGNRNIQLSERSQQFYQSESVNVWVSQLVSQRYPLGSTTVSLRTTRLRWATTFRGKWNDLARSLLLMDWTSHRRNQQWDLNTKPGSLLKVVYWQFI